MRFRCSGNDHVVFSGGNTKYPDFTHIKTKAPIEMRTDKTLDKIINTVKEKYPESYGFALDLGHEHMDDHEHANFEVYVKHLSYSYHKTAALFSMKIQVSCFIHMILKTKLWREGCGANYDIHVGAILGLPTKIIAFIVSLIVHHYQ